MPTELYILPGSLTASRTSKTRHNAIRSIYEQHNRVKRWFEATDDRNPAHNARWERMQEIYAELPDPNQEWDTQKNYPVAEYKALFRYMQNALNHWEKKQA